MNSLELLKIELSNTDKTIKKLDLVLDSAQPNLEGKIRVFYWHTQGKKRDQEPILVSREKVWGDYPKRIPAKNLSKRAKCSGLFSNNYFSTFHLLSLLNELLLYRKRLKMKISLIEAISKSTLNLNKNRLKTAEFKIIQINQNVFNNLKKRELLGYYKDISENLLLTRD